MFSISLLIIAAAIVYMVEAYIHTYYAVEYMHGTSLFFVLLAQYGVPVLFLLLCAHIIYKQTEKKREKEQNKTDTQAESKEEKYLTQINAVVGTKTIFSEQADQMRYQVRRFGQKMATAYSMTQDSKRLTNILVCIPSSFKCILRREFHLLRGSSLTRNVSNSPKNYYFRTLRLQEGSFYPSASALLYFRASLRMQEKLS